MSRRWRPSLGFVLGGALLGTLGLSFVGLIALRHLGPEIGFRNAAALIGCLIALATGVLGWLLVRLLLRPIRGLERYARAHEAGDPEVEPPRHFGTRELHATAQRVITMAETLRDREASIRAFSDHVVHELKTPISGISAAIELLEDPEAPATEQRKLLGEIDGACRQLEQQLAALREAANAREVRYLGHSHLSEILPDLASEHPDIEIRVEGGDVPIPLAREGLELILGQLLQNSKQHDAKSVSLRASAALGRSRLTISDDGAGVSPGNANRLFDPYFTTRRDVGGTGMGLAIVQNVMAAHRGSVDLVPSDRGASFQLSFRNRS